LEDQEKLKVFIRDFVIHHHKDPELINGLRADLIQKARDSVNVIEFFETELNLVKQAMTAKI